MAARRARRRAAGTSSGNEADVLRRDGKCVWCSNVGAPETECAACGPGAPYSGWDMNGHADQWILLALFTALYGVAIWVTL